MVVPRGIRRGSLEPLNVILYGRVYVDVINLRISDEAIILDYLGGHKCPHKREAEGDQAHRGEADMDGTD